MISSQKIDLERIQFLLVDDNVQSLDIMSQVVSAFGVRSILKCTSAAEARTVMGKTAIDFLLTDAQMPGEDGYTLTRWVRTEAAENTRFIPIILVTGHTPRTHVMRARDCGAHFVVAKPLTPKVLLERIFWVANDQRKYIESEGYCGPDRRFQRMGPPVGTEGRRSDDRSGALGDPAEPNLSQDDINALMKPAKVAL